MKARTQGDRCAECRKKTAADFKKAEYNFFKDTVTSAACMIIATAIWTFERKGRTPKYIKNFFDDMKMLLDYPTLGRKRLNMTDVMQEQAEKYGLDWDEIKIHIESRDAFLESLQRDSDIKKIR